MKRAIIDQIFTNKVAQYITEGYIINSSTMCGSQGEVGKVDLVKGDSFIRVWINRESEFDFFREDHWNGSKLVIRVGKWNYPASDVIKYAWSTVWMKDLTTIEEIVFYEIKDGWYVDNREEALAAQEKRYSRYIPRVRNETTTYRTEEAQNIASSYLKRVYGYKRVSRKNLYIKKIVNVEGNATYYVMYNNEAYRMIR